MHLYMNKKIHFVCILNMLIILLLLLLLFYLASKVRLYSLKHNKYSQTSYIYIIWLVQKSRMPCACEVMRILAKSRAAKLGELTMWKKSVENWHSFCYVTEDIITKLLLKWFLSSSPPTTWGLCKLHNLAGCLGNCVWLKCIKWK